MDIDCALSGYAEHTRRFTNIDKRTRAWRRRAELIALFSKQLGAEMTEPQRLDIERLSDLVLIAETKRAAMLKGEPVNIAELTKLENSISRLKWSLGLGRRKRQDLGPGLAQALEAAK
jgi:hypothetical protein